PDAVLAALGGGGALFFRVLAARVNARLAEAGPAARGQAGAHPGGQAGRPPAWPARPAGSASAAVTDQDMAAAVWDLVWAGRLTNDTIASLRTVLGAGRPRPASMPAGGQGGAAGNGSGPHAAGGGRAG